MGFVKYPLPTQIPSEIQAVIAQLEQKSQDQKSYLAVVYDFILQKNNNQWQHTRFKAGTQLYKLFKKDLAEIWNAQGFVYCQSINLLMRVMLAGSKFFKDEDVRVKHTFLNFVLHQYLQVKVGDGWVDADPAGSGIRNRPLGTHASIFG